MPDLDAEVAAILADALAQGFGESSTYTILATAASSSITVCVQELGQPWQHTDGAEVRRREVNILLRSADITLPAKGDTIVIAAGIHTGTWTVFEATSGDTGAWVVRARLDTRTRMGTGRRLP